jgi:hypothetical protein
MIAPPFVRILVTLLSVVPARPSAPPRRSARHRCASRALAFGGLVFGALTLGLAVAAETVKPQWRDPGYGNRLIRLQLLTREHPARPLVVVLGSSRAEMGVSPRDVGFPDQPGQPLVFNFGYHGALPWWTWLEMTRLLDDGVHPAAVLVMISAFESKFDDPIEDRLPLWGARLSGIDLCRLAPYMKDPAVFHRALVSARCDPWSARRTAFLADVCPALRLDHQGESHLAWDEMDRYGFIPLEKEHVSDELRARAWAYIRTKHTDAFCDRPVGTSSDRALRDLIARCRAERIAVAVMWAPESPAYRGLFAPGARAVVDEYNRALATEPDLRVFPAPDHLGEEDFMDGVHLFHTGAVKYSRWLADHHLKAWLADVLKIDPSGQLE